MSKNNISQIQLGEQWVMKLDKDARLQHVPQGEDSLLYMLKNDQKGFYNFEGISEVCVKMPYSDT